MIPLNIVFLLLFIILLKQKKQIVEHIKQDPMLLEEFYQSLNMIEGSTNFVPENIDIDKIIHAAETGPSDNETLTFKNFCSKYMPLELEFKLSVKLTNRCAQGM